MPIYVKVESGVDLISDSSDISSLKSRVSTLESKFPVSVANGGTGATSAASARSNLGITPANIGAATSSHTHTGNQITGLTANRALISNSSGQVAVSAVTSTELGYLDGVTSKIQSQLNNKASTSHTHKSLATHTASGSNFVIQTATNVSTARQSLSMIWGSNNSVLGWMLYNNSEARAILGYDAGDDMVYANEPVFKVGTNQARIMSGANQQIYIGASNENAYRLFLGVRSSSWCFTPATNGYVTLGQSSYRWAQIYSTTASISTSDRNEKKDIETLDENRMYRFINAIDPVSYKFIENTSDRTHFGMIAQQIEEAMQEVGLSDKDFAGYIKSPKVRTIESPKGTEDTWEEVPGEYTYGLRYEEFISPIISCVQHQAKLIDELFQRIEKLESYT